MNNNEKVLRFYFLATSLKNKIRQGSIYWNVSNIRRESIAEHVYDTCMLAIALHSEFDIDADIYTVILMLAIHELEEVVIGDITPFDGVCADEKLKRGKLAVENILSSLKLKDDYIELTDEFNAGLTREAKFAYVCDKLDFVLQMMLYTDKGCITLEGAKESPVVQSDAVQAMIKSGVNSPKDVFYLYDRNKFIDNVEVTMLLDYAYELNLKEFVEKFLKSI